MKKIKSYAGIGSRSTPTDLKPIIKEIVETLNEKGYILRSGGASGADTFFEEYANKKEIYLPWPNFNQHQSELNYVCNKAFELAEQFHPAWNMLSYAAKKLIARNGYQVLGENLDDPVEFIVCWTPEGKEIGGTSQAMRIAKHYGIPIFNLFSDIENIKEHLSKKTS